MVCYTYHGLEERDELAATEDAIARDHHLGVVVVVGVLYVG